MAPWKPMTAPCAHADPMLERAVRLGAMTARLPALPVHDWLDRAAGVIAYVVPGAAVLVLLRLPTGENRVERFGAAGPGTDAMDRDPRSLMRQVELLPPIEHEGLVVEPAPAYFRARLGGVFASAPECLVATAPLAEGEARRLLLVVAARPSDQVEAVLWLAMPDLVARALVALGPAPSASAQWLLPGDLQLIEGLVAGKTIAEIARDSDRKEHAVQDAIKAMYRRLGRNRRTDLVARAVGHVPVSEIEGKGGT
jgi:DNA-binding CsgD family transcriptional regulator